MKLRLAYEFVHLRHFGPILRILVFVISMLLRYAFLRNIGGIFVLIFLLYYVVIVCEYLMLWFLYITVSTRNFSNKYFVVLKIVFSSSFKLQKPHTRTSKNIINLHWFKFQKVKKIIINRGGNMYFIYFKCQALLANTLFALYWRILLFIWHYVSGTYSLVSSMDVE